MRISHFAVIQIFLLVLSVPWFFSAGDAEAETGFPAWALYAFFLCGIYAVVMALCILKIWPNSDSEEN